jgi:hypothetical protein
LSGLKCQLTQAGDAIGTHVAAVCEGELIARLGLEDIAPDRSGVESVEVRTTWGAGEAHPRGADLDRASHARAACAVLLRPRSEISSAAVDGQGNVYIADYCNDLVRKVDTSGTISTVASDGSGLRWPMAQTSGQSGQPDQSGSPSPGGQCTDACAGFHSGPILWPDFAAWAR